MKTQAFVILLPLLFTLSVWSASPVPYSGKVAINGVNFSGQAQFIFSLFDGTGATHWRNGSSKKDTIGVKVVNGRYSVLLGGQGMNPLPPELFLTHNKLFLKVEFDNGDGKGLRHLAPDQLITATPKALVAEVAKFANVAEVANGVRSGSVTKEMLNSELTGELLLGNDNKNTLSNSNLIALPFGQKPPEGFSKIVSGIPKVPKNWKLSGNAGLTNNNPSTNRNSIILAEDQIHFIKYQYDYPNWFLKHNIYNIKSGEWEDLSQNHKNGKHLNFTSNVYHNGKIYLIGGSNQSNEGSIKYKQYMTNEVQIFDIESKKWSSFTSLPQPSFGGNSLIYKGKLYYSGKILDGKLVNYSYDFNKQSWNEEVKIIPGHSWCFAHPVNYHGDTFTSSNNNLSGNDNSFPDKLLLELVKESP